MPRHRVLETFVVALATIGLIATPLTPAAAADSVIADDDFSSPLSTSWQQSGGPTLSIADVDSNPALQVANRANDYDGIETAPGVLEAGETYSISMRVRLAAGTTGPAQFKIVSVPGYATVGTESAVTDAAWTTLQGEVTFAADAADPKVYIGSSALSGAYTYFVDDVVLTLIDTSAPAEVVVSDDDFSSPLSVAWRQSGGPTLTIVDVESNPALRVANRANDFDGIETAPGTLAAGNTYTVSVRARVAADAGGSPSLRFVQNFAVEGTQQYVWVDGTNTAITADGWTSITGTFTLPANATTPRIYVGTSNLSGAYTYFLDDLVLTTTDDGGDVITPSPDVAPGGFVNPTTTELATAQGTGNVAALTFDDGPAEDTADLLDFLAEEEIKAVFCVIGSQIEQPGGAELLRRIVAEGHVLCNHSTGFADMGGYTVEQAQTDLEENLRIIREALGDDEALVPFFRAPNGSWGQTREVAVALGMQPLAVTNTIQDWDGNDLSVETLEQNIRTAMQPGRILLAHDGPANRANTVTAISTVVRERLADGWTFTLPAGTPPPTDPGTPGEVIFESSFEDGLAPFVLRRSSDIEGVTPTASVTTDLARTGAQSAVVASRGNQGDGLGLPTIGLLLPGITYDLSAWVRFAAGQPAGDIWVTLQADSSFLTQAQVTGLSNGEWREVTASFTMPPNALSTGLLYFETAYVPPPATGNTTTFYVDDVTITQAEELTIEEDLTPIKSTVDFPAGVAIDSRETGGAQSDLVNLHFEQVTAENSMKPEAFYNNAREFIAPGDATTVMDFAAENDLRVWGHTLVWHSQTPAWFFQTAEGAPLTTSETDQQILRDRMREHIFSVAELYADEYGLYGDGNPIVAFDVVNEVITDASGLDDGLRRSEWYRILGEEFIDLAFEYADEAFNDVYAAEGADRPVTLFINDYNTELTPKGTRMLALLERLLDRDVPVDGVGHQMHVSLSFPVDDLGATLERFEYLGLQQAVTEFDVPTGTPESAAKFIDQGYFYRDAFRAFREFDDRTGQLFSVTVWGLSDNRSWRAANGGPLLFDAQLQAKPSYFGVVDDELEPPQRSANVFGATVTEVDDRQWERMPSTRIDSTATFQVRWSNDELHVLVDVDDAMPQASDAVELQLGTSTVTIDRDDAQRDDSSGWSTVVSLPLGGAEEGDLVQFDVRVIDGGDVRSAWNSPGVLGTLTLLEPLSFVEVVETAAAPVIDGEIDAAWEAATEIETGKQVEGTSGATATARTLWRGDQLYVLMEVTDPVVDVSGSDPWIQDSVEIYVDAGNFKNGSYRYDDTQIRISADNVVTFGAGDEPFQRARVQSETSRTATGYIVETAISLLTESGLGTVHGFDVQVNDAQSGARQSIRNWADPSTQGYLSTARWGVAQLVSAPDAPPQLALGNDAPRAGDEIDFVLEGLEPGAEVELVLVPDTGDAEPVLGVRVMSSSSALQPAAVEFPLSLGTFTADENGRVSGSVTIPSTVPAGDYLILALVDGEEVASIALSVLPTAAVDDDDELAATGATTDLLSVLLMALLLFGIGLAATRGGRRESTLRS